MITFMIFLIRECVILNSHLHLVFPQPHSCKDNHKNDSHIYMCITYTNQLVHIGITLSAFLQVCLSVCLLLCQSVCPSVFSSVPSTIPTVSPKFVAINLTPKTQFDFKFGMWPCDVSGFGCCLIFNQVDFPLFHYMYMEGVRVNLS